MYEKCLPNKKFLSILVKFGKPKIFSLSLNSIRMENRGETKKSYFLTVTKFYGWNFVDFNAINKNVFSSVAFDWCYKIKSLIINNFTIWNALVFFFFFLSNLQTFYFGGVYSSVCISKNHTVTEKVVGECENQFLNFLWT